MRGRHEKLDVYFISQSFFGLPRQSIIKTSDKKILFKQTLRGVQSLYYDIGAYDMKYEEFKKKCRKAWSDKVNCVCFEMPKYKNYCKYLIFNESKNTNFECIPESEASCSFESFFQLKVEMV